MGDYCDGRIRLSCSSFYWEEIVRTLIHEIGHHVDDMEDISSEENLQEEFDQVGKTMFYQVGRKNVGEYLAVGFEIFYSGNKAEKRLLKDKHPALWKAVGKVHRRFRRSR